MPDGTYSMRILVRMQWCHHCKKQSALFLVYDDGQSKFASPFEGQCVDCGYDYGQNFINDLNKTTGHDSRPSLWIDEHPICPECASIRGLGFYRGNEPIAFECYSCGYVILPTYLTDKIGLPSQKIDQTAPT